MTDDQVRGQIELLRGLRAVRSFIPDPVPEAALTDMLEVARWTGTATNRQHWELIVVRDRDVLRQLSELDGWAQHLAGAALGIVLVMAGKNRDQETYDEGRLAERIMLAAKTHGLGSCIGWVRGEGAKELLGVPAERTVRTILSIGYPDPALAAEPKRRGARKPLGDFVHHERYGSTR